MSAGNPTERPEERDSLEEILYRLTAGYDFGHNDSAAELTAAMTDLRTLINEVKELREENAGLERTIGQDRDAWGRAESRIKQMEEALREAEAQLAELYDDPGPIIFKPEHRDWWRT